MNMRPAVIIPVYNHGEQIGEVIRQSLELGLPVFVVDDGSTDSTGRTLSRQSTGSASCAIPSIRAKVQPFSPALLLLLKRIVTGQLPLTGTVSIILKMPEPCCRQ